MPFRNVMEEKYDSRAESSMNITDNEFLRGEIDRLTCEWIQEKNRVNKLERSLHRISGICGMPDASEACRNILKEIQRVLEK